MTESVNFLELMDQASADFDPVPKDTYECEVVECKATKTQKGKTMFETKFNILSGPYANRKVWNNFTISPENSNALGFFFKHMKAMGLDRDYFASQPTPQQIADALVGRRAQLKVGHREYGGVVRNNVTDVLPPAGGVQGGAPAGMPGGGAVPPAPTPAPAPQAVPPAPTPAPAPAPQAAPPAPAPQQAAPAAPAAGTVPPGMDAEQYQAFLAFQQQQAAAQPAQPQNGAPQGAPQPPF